MWLAFHQSHVTKVPTLDEGDQYQLSPHQGTVEGNVVINKFC